MTPEERADIRARVEATTPGYWEYQVNPACACEGRREHHMHVLSEPEGCRVATSDGDSVFRRANAEFIANSKRDVLNLLAEIERLQSADTYCTACEYPHEGLCRVEDAFDESPDGAWDRVVQSLRDKGEDPDILMQLAVEKLAYRRKR